MKIQSNLNIEYNIHVHCTENMHLNFIRRVADIENFSKRGDNPQNISIVT